MKRCALLFSLLTCLSTAQDLSCGELEGLALRPMTEHKALVEGIANEVKSRETQLVSLKRGRGQGHTVRQYGYKEGTTQVDVSGLDQIVSLSTLAEDSPFRERGAVASAVAESAVTMEQLVTTLLPQGLVPCVVPEFRMITVGGAIQGLAAESTSHRFGLFHDQALDYELILGDGEVITAAPEGDYSSLFYAIPGSYGSLAILSSATIALCPAMERVSLELTRFPSVPALMEHFGSTHGAEIMFQEGIGYGPKELLAIEGRYCRQGIDCPATEKSFDSFLSPWFFEAVRSYEKAGLLTFSVPTEEYLFRHDRGAFWMASYKIPSLIGRILGPLLSTRRMFELSSSPYLKWAFPRHTIMLQDFMLPHAQVASFTEYLDDKLALWPLWFLPMRNEQTPQHIMSLPHSVGPYTNVGSYGQPRSSYDYVPDNIDMERVLSAKNGRKVFYSHAYYSKEEFAALYDMETYGKLRKQYGGAEAFRSVEEKV
ncbi:unnamed protein product [Chrysoparadoxa australica]